jgi:hypothetical protein
MLLQIDGSVASMRHRLVKYGGQLFILFATHAPLLAHFKENYVPKPYFFRPSFGMAR